MIVLRPFRPEDWAVISQYQYPGISQDDAIHLIAEFNAPTYQGKFQKFYAVEWDSQIVGYVSIIEQSRGSVSVGAEIYQPFRRQGYAYNAITQLFVLSKSLGYHTATGQVRQDNTASLALCRKLEFSVVNESISRRGKPVYNLIKSI